MSGSAAKKCPDAPSHNDTRFGLDFGNLETSAGFVLRIAQLTAFERFFEIMPPDTIRLSELTMLLAISENPGVRQGVLADALRIKWPNMTKLVRSLEERDWIARHIPPKDRRSVELRVTKKGAAALDAAAATMYALDRKVFEMLDDQEHSQLLNLLRKVAGWPEADSKGEASR
jgi:DNA-binding MarR family transcriptional regulator